MADPYPYHIVSLTIAYRVEHKGFESQGYFIFICADKNSYRMEN
jgi:hypothetical protein